MAKLGQQLGQQHLARTLVGALGRQLLGQQQFARLVGALGRRELAGGDFNWLLAKEVHGHNTVFWAVGADQASGGSGGRTAFRAVDADPASGGSGGRTWYIRTGQYTTPADVFWKGRRDFTCAQLYRMYCNMDILIHRMSHANSKGSQQKHGRQR